MRLVLGGSSPVAFLFLVHPYIGDLRGNQRRRELGFFGIEDHDVAEQPAVIEAKIDALVSHSRFGEGKKFPDPAVFESDSHASPGCGPAPMSCRPAYRVGR